MSQVICCVARCVAHMSVFEKCIPFQASAGAEIGESNQNKNGRMEAFSRQRQTKVKEAGLGSECWRS